MKAMIKVSLTLLLILLLLVSCLIALLATSYSSQITQKLITYFAPPELHIQNAQFIFPNQIELQQLAFSNADKPAVTIDDTKITFALNWDTPLFPLYIKRIYLNEVNVPTSIPSSKETEKWLHHWRPQSIHIQNLDFANSNFIARDFELTFTPDQSDKALLSNGYLSAAGEQLYWKGEAFNQFKLRAKLAPNLLQIDQLDFAWRGGEVQLIAEKKDQNWTVNDILIKQLRLSQSDLPKSVQLASQQLLSNIDKIEHAKSYQSSWDNGEWQLNLANIKIANWNLQQPFWHQEAQVSLSAESLIGTHIQLLEPQLNLTLSPQNLQLNQLEFLFEQGKVKLDGVLSPKTIHLNKLFVSNLEWITEGNASQTMVEHISKYDDISIDELSVTRSQIITLGENTWQVSNLNAQGKQLSIRKQNRWALWNGDFSASANSLSLYNQNSLKPYIEMQSEQDLWKINKLFLPTQDGLIEGQGNIDLSQVSQPWKVSAKAYRLPLDILTPSLNLAVGWHGFADLNVELQGLAGDELMFRRSLDGSVNISAHDVQVQLPFDEAKLYPLIIPEVELQAHRGQIELPNINIISENLNSEITGSLDIAKPTQNQLSIKLSNECISLKKSFPQGRSQLKYEC